MPDSLEVFVADLTALGWTPLQIARNINEHWNSQDKADLKRPPVAPAEDDEPEDDKDDEDDRSGCGVNISGIERALRELVKLQRDQVRATEAIRQDLRERDARDEHQRTARGNFLSGLFLFFVVPVMLIVGWGSVSLVWWLGSHSALH